jgi:hypothetical protein
MVRLAAHREFMPVDEFSVVGDRVDILRDTTVSRIVKAAMDTPSNDSSETGIKRCEERNSS